MLEIDEHHLPRMQFLIEICSCVFNQVWRVGFFCASSWPHPQQEDCNAQPPHRGGTDSALCGRKCVVIKSTEIDGTFWMTGRVTIYSLVFHMTLTIFYNFYKWFRVVGPLNATEYGHMSCERKKKESSDYQDASRVLPEEVRLNFNFCLS